MYVSVIPYWTGIWTKFTSPVGWEGARSSDSVLWAKCLLLRRHWNFFLHTLSMHTLSGPRYVGSNPFLSTFLLLSLSSIAAATTVPKWTRSLKCFCFPWNFIVWSDKSLYFRGKTPFWFFASIGTCSKKSKKAKNQSIAIWPKEKKRIFGCTSWLWLAQKDNKPALECLGKRQTW